MPILASDSFATGLTVDAAITGRILDNAGGGTGTRAWTIFTSGAPLLGASGGRVKGASTLATSLAPVDGCRKATVPFDPAGATSGIAVHCCSGAGLTSTKIGALLTASHTSLRVFEYNASGTRVDLVTLTITAPGAPFQLQIDATNPAATVARVLTEAGAVRNATAAVEVNLPPGNLCGPGFFQAGQTGTFGTPIFEDGPTYASPAFTSTGTPTATSPTTATAPFTTDIASGLIYYVSSSGSPDEAAILAGASKAVTAVGAQSLSITGLTAGSTGNKIHAIHRRAEGVNSAIVRTATFSTPAPIAPPGGSTAVTFAGDTVTVTYTPSGTVASATASLPVAGTPGGAVAQGPKPMTFDGVTGKWVAEFTSVVPGSYAAPVVLASNVDNPSVSITGAQAFTIIPLNGSDEPDGSELPDVPVAFAGPIPAQAATVGVPFSLDLADYFIGTRLPFTYSLTGTLTGSGLSRTGSVISGTPSSAATLAALVGHATDADGATADTNTFTITVAAAADGTKPVMTGIIAITAKTNSSYTSSVSAATDNVGVTGYRVSEDGGSTWIDKATARAHDHAGRTPGATDQVRWSARDAAGNWADPLALAVTLDVGPSDHGSPTAMTVGDWYFRLRLRCTSA